MMLVTILFVLMLNIIQVFSEYFNLKFNAFCDKNLAVCDLQAKNCLCSLFAVYILHFKTCIMQFEIIKANKICIKF